MSAEPFWSIVGVFDPDGNGADFSYTVGLASRGLPELHLWARPSEGHDPGHDWSFNHRERGALINEFAMAFVAGELVIGSEIVREFDGSAATCTFRLDPPVARDELDAFQADDGAQVIPVRWTLTRAPEGTLGPLTPDAEPRVRATLAALRSTLDESVVLPSPWRPTSEVNLDPAQPFGPLTPLVGTYGALVACADVATLVRFCDYAMLADDSVSPRNVLALTAAAARPAGRSAALRAVHAAAADLVEHVSGKSGPTRRWRDLLTELGGGDMSRSERDSFSSALANLFRYSVAALLTTAAVDDVLDEADRLAGYGPWVWACASPLEAPEPWRADPETRAAVVDLLGDLDAEGLLTLADIQAGQLNSDDSGADPDAAHLARWLAAQSITGKSGLPPLSELLAGTPAAQALAHVAADPGAGERDLVDIASAATTLCAALAHASDLPPQARALLDEAYGGLLPGLSVALEKRAAGIEVPSTGSRP